MPEWIRKANRVAFGEALLSLGEEIPNMVVLDADISSSLNTKNFAQRNPDRHINFGAAEQNMMIGAAGLSTTGFIPLACTYAAFASMRACEQLRSFICYGALNVKIIASHGGIEVGWDGPTHQATEDIAITRSMPNMTVVVPADATSVPSLLRQTVMMEGPVYFRMGRNPVPVIYPETQTFSLGKAVRLNEGADVTLIATGVMVSIAIETAERLMAHGIRPTLFDMHTIKPIDEVALLEAAYTTPMIVTMEDHNIIGGLGSAVVEYLSSVKPTLVLRIGVPDTFAESGDPVLLFKKYQMDPDSVAMRVETALDSLHSGAIRS